MAKVKNLNRAIVREPESAGAEIERRAPDVTANNRLTTSPKTAGVPLKSMPPLADPFPAR